MSRELARMEEVEGAADERISERARPIPRISIQAFCERPESADAIQVAAEDRRLIKTHVSVHMGGVQAAVAHYMESPTPNLIIVESTLPHREFVGELDRLAETCDAGTKVIVIGHTNDVALYREVLRRGVSEYLIAPVTPLELMECLSGLYNDPQSDPVGHVYAFVGAKGGVGSSTICHNVAWTISEMMKQSVVIADLDLPFGTAGLDFNQDPVQGIADAISTPERLEEVLLDRLLTKCSEYLSIFAAPGALDREYDLSADACDLVLDVVRQNVPYVALDVPHMWTEWTKRLVLNADSVIITAAPDLANLRNAKNMFDLIKQARHNDKPPMLVLSTVGVPKRPEISVKDFEAAMGIKATAIVEFDCETFGQAANNGQMVEEMAPKARAVPAIHEIAGALTGRREQKVAKAGALDGILGKLRRKR